MRYLTPDESVESFLYHIESIGARPEDYDAVASGNFNHVFYFQYKRLSDAERSIELQAWCNENCSGDFFVYNCHYILFELESDVTAFKLRWC